VSAALYLVVTMGSFGAFDTLYYHEWRARLPARGRAVGTELRLHAFRDVIYAILFSTLPTVQWRGGWMVVLLALLIAEIVITLWDFVVEDRVRKPLGGVYPGERITHALMGINYGAMLACLAPTLWLWGEERTALILEPAPVSRAVVDVLMLMAGGVLVSGLRDFYASFEFPLSEWPWKRAAAFDGSLK